jgi:23S rRNA (adenine2503-C2)-methyltransferase
MQISDFDDQLRAAGANPAHAARVLRLWSHALPQSHGRRAVETFLPASLLAALPGIETQLAAIARVRSVHPASDGAERLLVELPDGQTVESVLLPRGGLCISSQVGCAVGCLFCMTGRDGLLRQLGSAEMVAQVALARRRRAVKKVVFMGMGEPAHNLDAVLQAIDFLGTLGGIRRALLPRAPRMTPQELVDAGERYARASGYPIQYQWTLMAGVNDGDDEIEGIVRLLAGKYGVLNMIPFNAVEGTDFRRPPWERAAEIARRLHRRGVLTKLRQSAAQDVDGGCGQLRARETGAETRIAMPRRAA